MIKMRITFCKFFNSNAQRERGGGGLQLYKLIFLAAEPQLRCGINRVCAVAAFNALKQMIPAGVGGGSPPQTGWCDRPRRSPEFRARSPP